MDLVSTWSPYTSKKICKSKKWPLYTTGRYMLTFFFSFSLPSLKLTWKLSMTRPLCILVYCLLGLIGLDLWTFDVHDFLLHVALVRAENSQHPATQFTSLYLPQFTTYIYYVHLLGIFTCMSAMTRPRALSISSLSRRGARNVSAMSAKSSPARDDMHSPAYLTFPHVYRQPVLLVSFQISTFQIYTFQIPNF